MSNETEVRLGSLVGRGLCGGNAQFGDQRRELASYGSGEIYWNKGMAGWIYVDGVC